MCHDSIFLQPMESPPRSVRSALNWIVRILAIASSQIPRLRNAQGVSTAGTTRDWTVPGPLRGTCYARCFTAMTSEDSGRDGPKRARDGASRAGTAGVNIASRAETTDARCRVSRVPDQARRDDRDGPDTEPAGGTTTRRPLDERAFFVPEESPGISDLPKACTPRDVESAIYEHWLAADVLAPDGAGATTDPSLPPFTIIQPPPNVTSSRHLGRATDRSGADNPARGCAATRPSSGRDSTTPASHRARDVQVGRTCPPVNATTAPAAPYTGTGSTRR
jgi:hypothetical protein